MLKVAVIGLGRFGTAVARQLTQAGAEVLAVDRSVRLVEAVADDVAVAVGFDATELANLEAYDVGSFDVAVVAIGENFEASVLVAMHCKQLGVGRVFAKAMNAQQEAVLMRVGADAVIRPEEDMGKRLAEHLLRDDVVDFVQLPEGYRLGRLVVPEDWDGRTLAELDLLGTRRLNLVQIVRRSGAEAEEADPRVALPGGAEVLHAGDEIDVIGLASELDRLE